jgi:hypothetical protein
MKLNVTKKDENFRTGKALGNPSIVLKTSKA